MKTKYVNKLVKRYLRTKEDIEVDIERLDKLLTAILEEEHVTSKLDELDKAFIKNNVLNACKSILFKQATTDKE